MSYTITRTETNTYTEARARHALGKVYENLIGLMNCGVITKSRADRIRSDIMYLLSKSAIEFFEIQFSKPNGLKFGGLHYKVVSNGYIYSDDDSGGFDFWLLPKNTLVDLLIHLDYNSPNINEVQKKLKEWGWGVGNRLEGESKYLKSYSKDGYGFKENKIGTW